MSDDQTKKIIDDATEEVDFTEQGDLINSMMGLNMGGDSNPGMDELMAGGDQAQFMEMLQQMMMGGMGGEGEFEGEASFDFASMMQEMIAQFTSKEALYEPCLEIIPKYEEYLESATDITEAERDRYTAQLNAYQELKELLETDETNQPEIMAKVEAINNLGEPPVEIQADENIGSEEPALEGCPQQ